MCGPGGTANVRVPRYGVHGMIEDALKLVAGWAGWADRIYGTGGDVHYSQLQ